MKVMHIISGLSRGGAEQMLLKLIEYGAGEGDEWIVVSLTDHGEIGALIEEQGVPVVAMGMRMKSALKGIWRLSLLIRDERPDVIQCWMYHGNLFGSLARWFSRLPIPLIWNVRHSASELGEEKTSTRWVIKVGGWLAPSAALVLYNSNESRESHALIGYDRASSKVIPNGFDTDRFKPDEQAREEVRKEWDVPPNVPVIGIAARYQPVKDHYGFLKAARLLLDQGVDARFVLVGREVEMNNPLFAGWVEELGLTKQVLLLGERADIPRLMTGWDIGTLCSRTEGFPNVIGEMMSMAVPCVVTDVGDSAYIVDEFGVVVPPGEPERLAAGWRQLIDTDPARRAVLGAACRNRVADHFSITHVVTTYQSLYRSLAA